MSTHSTQFKKGDIVNANIQDLGVCIGIIKELSIPPTPTSVDQGALVKLLGGDSPSFYHWVHYDDISPLRPEDLYDISRANIPRTMNSQANFSVGVDEVPQGFSCRLISPDGAIFMEREFRSRHEAESHRDRLIEAWNGGLNHRPTRVLKLVEDELQKP